MDNQIVFSLFDSKALYFLKPFNLRNKGEALRMFADIANDTKTPVGLHPEDYTLFELGTFNEQKGTYTNLKTPQSLGIAQEFVKIKKEEK